MRNSQLSGLKLILTSQCNMHCSYCYQTARATRHMSWRTMQMALDLALRSTRSRFTLLFYGGEPLLRFAQIGRAVAYLLERNGQGNRFEFTVVTNGLLLSPEIGDFLEAHDFRLLLSFDGPGAQAARRIGSFQVLDDLVARLRNRDPKLFQDSLTICITLTPHSIRYLADSVDYFIREGIARIGLSPAITDFPMWNENRIAELETQFERIYHSSVKYRDATGKVPFVPFGPLPPARQKLPNDRLCGAVVLRSPTVDADGQVYSCPLFAHSVQAGKISSFLRDREWQALGKIEDPGLEQHLATLRKAGTADKLFAGRSSKHTRYAHCAECEYLDRCRICPFSAAYIAGNRDPSRVSDFACAVTRVALKYNDLMAPPRPETPADVAIQRVREWLDRRRKGK